MFPSEHILRLRQAAEEKFADRLAGLPRGSLRVASEGKVGG
jgi:acyl-CoA dehydrogenase